MHIAQVDHCTDAQVALFPVNKVISSEVNLLHLL
jgi:hypothetical protein